MKGSYKKLISSLLGIETYDKDGNKLEAKYANVLSNIPVQEVYDKMEKY